MAGLNSKRLLIVGAASGIGRATAALAAEAGAQLALLDKNGGELREAVAPGTSQPFTCEVDLRDRDGIFSAVDAAAEAMTGIDSLIVTAGVGSITPFDQQEEDDWDRTLAINLTGSFRACKAALGHLRQSSAGSIVLVASATGLLPAARGQTAYAASKAGLIGFARALSQELAPAIRVNTVCPGPVDTPLLPDMFRERLKQPGSGYPMQRAAEAEEVARLILFLAGDDSSYINGSSIAIDGGRSLH